MVNILFVQAKDAIGYGYAVKDVPLVLHPMDAHDAPITSSFTLRDIIILSGPRYGKAEVDLEEQALIYTADTTYVDQDTIVCKVLGYGAENFQLTYLITQAPDVESQGTEFWVGFLEPCLYCGFDDIKLRFTAASLYDADIQICDVGERYYSRTVVNFHVNAGSLASVDIPHEQENLYFGTKHFYNRGWLVTSSAPITLYAANTQAFSTDATGVLPAPALGSEYILQSWDAPRSDLPAEGLIIATENDTKIHLESPTEMIGVSGKVVDTTLQRGEVYSILVDAGATVPSLNGIHITAADNKKIACFQGVRMTFIPHDGIEAGDHIYEQAMPVSSWGKDFIVPYLSKQGRDFIRITAAQDGTNLTYNGQSISLNAQETYSGPISKLDYEEIHANNPIACYVYSSCQNYLDSINKSDPAMMVIHPDKQLTYKSIFHSFNLVNGNPSKHYIILTGRNIRECDVTLDGQPIGRGGTVEPVFYRRLEVKTGVHTLECPSGILGYAYGCAHHETYAYPVASMFRELKDTLVVIEDTICANELYHFGSHFYNETGVYYDTVRNLRWADSITELRLEVIPALKYEAIEYDTICNGDSYSWHGRIFKEDGFYSDTLTTIFGCDSVIHLDLFVRKKQITTGFWDDPFMSGELNYSDSLHPAFSDTVCSLPYIYHGKSYSASGIYADTLIDRYGCDSVAYFRLTVQGAIYSYTDTIIPYQELPFIWFGKEYNTYGIYHDTIQTAKGCDSIGTLRLLYSRNYVDTIRVCEDEPAIFHTPWGDVDAVDCDSLIGCIEMTEDSVCLSEASLYVIRNPKCACDTTYSTIDTTITYSKLLEEPLLWFGNTYSQPGVYHDTLFGANHDLCDSIGALLLRVIYKDSASVCNNAPYTFTTPWGVFTTPDGCDCLTGDIVKTADNESLVWAQLCVTRLQPTDSTTTATICEGETFNWYGHIYATSKDTTMKLTNAAGCDSICTLQLTVLPVTRQRFGRSICEGTTTTWRGRVLDKAGTYDTILYYVNGCDSIRDTLDLTIDEMYRDFVSYTICQGGQITWRGNTYTNAGEYSVHATGKNGDCDSILKLHIDVALPTQLDTSLYRCYSDPFPFDWDGHKIEHIGETVLHLTNKAGCDSTIRVTVYQSPELYTIENDTSFCDGSFIEDWHGKQIWNGGDYYYTEKCKNPHFATCDSVLYVLHVTKKQPTHGDTTIYVCACEMPIQMNFQGKKRTLDSQGTYNIFDLTNVAGCDSTLTLTIKVSDEVKRDIIDTSLCDGSSILWHGRTIDRAGDYYDTTRCKDIHLTRCDSIYHELHVTINYATDSVTTATICRGEEFQWYGETFTETTHRTITLTNVAGCDSVCTLHLIVNEPSSTLTTASICMGQTYKWNGYSFTNSVDTTIHLTNHVGCDSLCRLVLTASVCCPDTQMRRTVIPSMCDTLLPYHWQTWRTQPVLINDPGSYADTLRNKWGCDSIIYTLDIGFHHCCRDLKGEMNVGDVCADDDFLSLSLELHSGMMNEYRLHFTNPSLNQMPIRDTVVHLSEEDWATGTVHIDIPIPHDPEDSTRYPRPDNYFVDVLVSDSCGNTLRWEQVPFTIFYPSWLILQRWNDVLALYNEKYNGGYTFSQIRWFHEDTLLTARGEHNGYIYIRPTLAYGTPYYAELTRTDDGKTFPTCAYFPYEQRDTIIFKEEVKISHNLIGPGANRIGVTTNTNGTYDIYDIGGHCVQHGYFGTQYDALYIDFDTRLPEGVYILLFRGKELLQPEKLIHNKE